MEESDKIEIDLTYKICIFGDSGVGKSTLVDRYLTNTFHDDIRSTLGATINIKILKVKNGKITLQIWDFGGEEKFKFIFPAYAQGSFGGIFMFDLTSKESVSNISEWLSIFKKASRNAPIILVGGKLDLKQDRVIGNEEVLNIMTFHRFDNYVECSSKTGKNVQLLFEEMVLEILKNKGRELIEFQ
jgi:small GTP-binding protein